MSLSNRCMWYLPYQAFIWSQNKEMCQTLKILNDSIRENKKRMYAKCRCYCGCENKLRCKYIAETVFPKILYRWILLQFLRSNKVHCQIFALLHEFDAWSEAKRDGLIWFKRSDVRETIKGLTFEEDGRAQIRVPLASSGCRVTAALPILTLRTPGRTRWQRCIKVPFPHGSRCIQSWAALALCLSSGKGSNMLAPLSRHLIIKGDCCVWQSTSDANTIAHNWSQHLDSHFKACRIISI